MSRNLVHTLHLVGVAAAWRKGSRLRDCEKIVDLLETILSPSLTPSHHLLSTSLHLTSSLLLVGLTTDSECHTHSPRLLRLLCSRGGCEEVEMVLKCFRELAEKHSSFLTVSQPPNTRHEMG